MAGRPKILTNEQVRKNLKLAQQNWRKNNRVKYNNMINTYNAKNRSKINQQQNARYKKKTLYKKDPFFTSDPLNTPSKREQISISRMAELIKVGCSEKKTKGSNYYVVSSKKNHSDIMKNIGFTHMEDVWISNSWRDMSMKLTGWSDIKKRNINYNKMVIYGRLTWVIGLDKNIVNIILSYLWI